jgi:hypothetical protein
MRTTQIFLRSGLTVAAAAALPLTLTAPSAVAAGSGISVSTSGTSVSVTTSACPTLNPADGSFGKAALLSSGQANFAQGRQTTLTGTTTLQSASWSNVSAGTYTVIVLCTDNTTAGTQSIIVSTPTISATATASASRGVMGGLGGATKDYGTVTLAGGGALVALGTVAAAWFLRRRAKPHRL